MAANKYRRADSICQAVMPARGDLPKRRCTNPFTEVMSGLCFCGVHANAARNLARKFMRIRCE